MSEVVSIVATEADRGKRLDSFVAEAFGVSRAAAQRLIAEGRVSLSFGEVNKKYAMRGGEIYVKGNAGYRAGVHMKAYGERVPVLVIGGRAGSFLGEYQAGGIILVLGLNTDGKPLVSNFPCTGMHGGKLFLRGDCTKILFPKQVTVHIADSEEKKSIQPYVEEYCRLFDADLDAIFASEFTVVEPDSKNPYKQMYVLN